ncbi:23134_t:CDS:2, partial [Dentiscutata erythropus]
ISNGSKVVYTITREEPDNSFSTLFSAIIAAYNWNSNLFDTWRFWPIIIIGVVVIYYCLITILCNNNNTSKFIKSAAFENANKNGKRAVLGFQSRLIYDYANLEGSAFTSKKSEFVSKAKDKFRESTPMYLDAESQIHTEHNNKFFINNDDMKSILASDNDDKVTQS